MMKENYSNFLKTKDLERIFYSTNFKIEDGKEYDNVLVFNYGLVCSFQHWQHQVAYFDNLGYKILMHDYRAHFQSSGQDKIERITFEQLAEDLHELLLHLNIKTVINLGHSMGVNVSLEFYRRYPEFTKGMVLISGTVLPVRGIMLDSNFMEFVIPLCEKGMKDYRKLMEGIWNTGGSNPIAKHIMRSQGFNSDKVSMEYIEIYLNRIGKLGPELFFQLFNQLSVHNIMGFLSQIKVPTLVIGGDQDKVIPPYIQKIIHEQIQGSELFMLKNGSHVGQVDFPEYVNERLELFFEKNSL